MIEYREGVASDFGELAGLRAGMLREGGCHDGELIESIEKATGQYIADGCRDGSYVACVAIAGDRVVGMGGVNFFRLPPNDWCPNGKTAYLGNMYVLPAYRRQGIAGHLLQMLLDEAKTRDCRRVLLNATEMGRPLYEKYGFGESPTAMAHFPFGIAVNPDQD